jgi:NAD(P)-dependent dehydrogenase (short-subunit alcohol dehydrogenase family)
MPTLTNHTGIDLDARPGPGAVAVVTGANSGIGKEIARGLLAAGLTVYIGARNADRGQAAVDDLGRRGPPARSGCHQCRLRRRVLSSSQRSYSRSQRCQSCGPRRTND